MIGVRRVDAVADTMGRGSGVTSSPTPSDLAITGCNLREPPPPWHREGGTDPELMQYVPRHSVPAIEASAQRVLPKADGLGGPRSEYTAVLDDGIGGAPWSIKERRQTRCSQFQLISSRPIAASQQWSPSQGRVNEVGED